MNNNTAESGKRKSWGFGEKILYSRLASFSGPVSDRQPDKPALAAEERKTSDSKAGPNNPLTPYIV